jgi:predicted RNA binding protein YcfA (HicA-like mRNA interferase family)
MPKLSTLTPKRLIQFLEKQGFFVQRTSGSHVILYHYETKKRAVVPFHRKDIPKGTLFSILKSAGFTKEDLSNF